MNLLKGFGRFWYEFLVGDDWKIAAAVVSVLVVGALVVGRGSYDAGILTILLAAGVGVTFALALLVDVRRRD